MSSNCWCCNKGEYDPSAHFKNLEKSQIYKSYANENVLTQIGYVEKHFPNLLEGAIKFPEAKFYLHGHTDELQEPDLVTDQQLRKIKISAGTSKIYSWYL